MDQQLSFSDQFFTYGLVEVLLEATDDDDTATWHEAFLLDFEQITNSDGSVINWYTVVLALDGQDATTIISQRKHVHKCTSKQVRMQLQSDQVVNFKPSDIVQVRVAEGEGDKFVCWKPGKIKMIREDLFVVIMGDLKNELNFDVLPRDMLRLPNFTKRLDTKNNPLFRFEIPLSQELLGVVHDNKNWLYQYELHKEFKKLCELISVYYDFSRKSFVCLAMSEDSFSKEKILKRTKMLSSMHFNKLKDSYLLKLDRMQMMPNLCDSTTNVRPESIVRVNLDPNLIGLAIGKAGVNIQKARAIEGVYSIDLDDDNSSFIIKGVSQEVCDKAASLINFVKEQLVLSNDFTPLLADRILLKEMVTKSGLFKLDLFEETNDDKCQGVVVLDLIGKVVNIENFKVILAFQKAEFDEINTLKCQNKEIMDKLFYQQQVNNPLVSLSPSFVLPRNFAEAVKAGKQN